MLVIRMDSFLVAQLFHLIPERIPAETLWVQARTFILRHLRAPYGRFQDKRSAETYSIVEIVQTRIVEPIHPLLNQNNACPLEC